MLSRLFRLALFVGLSNALPAAALFNLTLPWDDATGGAVSSASLNAPRAGSDGFVFVDAQGHFATTAGRLRFWGTNTTFGGNFPSNSDSAKVAARLAKFGFNIMRFHHMDNQTSPNGIWQSLSPDRTLNATQLSRLNYFINQLADQGIYSNLNLVVSRPFHPGTELDPSITGISDWKVRAVLGFFDPAQVAVQKAYASALLTQVNPYTGLAPINDPAVAFIEINNENGLVQAYLSQQLDTLPNYYKNMLNTQWNQWLTLKYGSHAVMEAAWGVMNVPLGVEKLANGTFASVIAPWNTEQTGGAVASAAVTADGAGGTNVARLTLTTPGTLTWHIQFNQGNVSVTAGTPYTLGFWAKADAGKTISVDLGMNHSPWGGLGFSSSLNLTTAWQYFEFTLSPSANDINARINFSGMGLQTGLVYIGNVSFKAGGLMGLYPGEDLGLNTMRNFLQSGELVPRTVEGRKDWFRFLLAKEEAYWLDLRDYVRVTLGAQNLIMGTVQGCSTPNLQAAFDAIDTHYYWRHPSFPGVPWDWADWYVENDAMIDDPTNSAPAAIGMQAVLGKPHSVTELNAPYPNTYEADCFMISAAYGGLQDWDAIYPFDYHGESINWSSANLQSFFSVNNNPVKMAGMAAAARAFRRGDFSPAAQMVAVPILREDEVTQLLTSWAWRLVNANTAGENARAALVHRVRMVVEGQTAPGGSLAPGTGTYPSVITADTGELRWDKTQATQGLVSGNTPRTQFAAGFFNGRSVALSSMTVSAVDSLQAGEYALVSLSSSDGLALSSTASALLTVLGCQRNTGSTYYSYPSTVIAFPPAKGVDATLRGSRGTGPVQVEGVSVTVRLGYATTNVTVYALNNLGQRGVTLPVTDNAGQAQVEVGPAYSTLWYEVVVVSPTPTPSSTPSPSVTETVSDSPSPTASSTVTQTWTASPGLTATPSPSTTDNVSATVTESSSPTSSPSISPSPSVTATPAAPAPVATKTPLRDSGGELKLRSALPVPHPSRKGTLTFAVDLLSGAETLRLRLYSAAYTRVVDLQLPGPYGPGWGSAVADASTLASGLYFYKMEPQRGGKTGLGVSGRLVVLD